MLATNVAETSLTVPGHPVRHRPRHGADLPLQPAHEGAAAADRADLAGLGQPARRPVRAHLATASASGCTPRRTSSRRPEFTDPEILRTNLASVHPADGRAGPRGRRRVPVHRPAGPPRRSPTASRCCSELGALEAARRRRSGSPRSAARWPQLPLDPRLARMVRGGRRAACLREVLVIAAALSIQDPRERPDRAPAGRRRAARPLRRRELRLPRASSTSGATSASSSERCRRSQFRTHCASRSSCTTCGSASGRTCTASCARIARRRWA